MTPARARPIVFCVLRAVTRWITRTGFERDPRAPAEAIVLRSLGFGYLTLFIVATVATRPHPGFEGKGLAIVAALIALVGCAIASMPRPTSMPAPRRIGLLVGVTAASATLAALQPKGIWQAGAYFVAIVSGAGLERAAAFLTFGSAIAAISTTAIVAGHGSPAVSVLLGVPPWFLMMRLMRVLRARNEALTESRAAESRTAAEAERGRLAREMHDVLAHSLSALALQLESARLVARDRDSDPEVITALDRAHHLAAQGLDEARRAIAAARGDQLPGPERLHVLTRTFEEQSGIPVSLNVSGEPRDLSPDAQVAIYRAAQEALTNIRRHATADHVEITLDYREDATVLVVDDRGPVGAPPPAISPGGYGLTGMRERAELLEGRLTAAPTSDGFCVELWLPTSAPVPSV